MRLSKSVGSVVSIADLSNGSACWQYLDLIYREFLSVDTITSCDVYTESVSFRVLRKIGILRLVFPTEED